MLRIHRIVYSNFYANMTYFTYYLKYHLDRTINNLHLLKNVVALLHQLGFNKNEEKISD